MIGRSATKQANDAVPKKEGVKAAAELCPGAGAGACMDGAGEWACPGDGAGEWESARALLTNAITRRIMQSEADLSAIGERAEKLADKLPLLSGLVELDSF